MVVAASRVSGEQGQRVLVDTSDLLMYLHHHSVVSGIQRVIAEVIPGIQARGNCDFVAYSAQSREFVLLDRASVEDLLHVLKHANEGDKSQIRPLVDTLQESIATSPTYVGTPGDVLAVLGAAWIYEGFFSAVSTLKENGVGVVVLLYDLIPIAFPGFSEEMILVFRQYLVRVAMLADRVPTISAATRLDFEKHCLNRGWNAPPGRVTKLAADQWAPDGSRSGLIPTPARAWDRPFVLFVSTIESRKNHILALRCWQQLIGRYGRDAVPDLVCVGRLGWDVLEFLEEFEGSQGLQGKISLLRDQVSDELLAALYRDCEFTIYPSKYEGWGLPVTESLNFGKPVVTARNSSLTEAGGDLAHYFTDNDLSEFVAAVESLLDPESREAAANRILEEHVPLGWNEVAEVLAAEIDDARRDPRQFAPSPELGTEYGLGSITSFHGGFFEGEIFLRFLDENRRLPLTQQLMNVERGLVSEMLVFGATLPLEPGGRPVAEGSQFGLKFLRPESGALFLVCCTGDGSKVCDLRVSGPVGTRVVRVPQAGAFSVPLGEGQAGEPVRIVIRPEQKMLMQSWVLCASQTEADVLVHGRLGWLLSRLEDPSDALVDPFDYKGGYEAVTSSRSWRITAPLRGRKAFRRRGH